jgi:hypothetical protein
MFWMPIQPITPMKSAIKANARSSFVIVRKL